MNAEPRRPCPACESTVVRPCGSKNGFDLFVCDECRSIFTGRLPLDNEDEDYDSYYSDANLTVPDFVGERIREIIEGFAGFRTINRLLDVGFGAGTIMAEAHKQEWEVSGIEVSRPAVEYARSKGHDVHHGTLSSAQFPDDSFDVITASEILEHLSDLDVELAEIFRILRPGGLFWATTPSARSLSFRLMKHNWTVLCPPEHMQLYSEEGARSMLRKAGFSNVRFQTLGLNPAEIIDFYGLGKKKATTFDRVASSYDLNQKMTRSPTRKRIKYLLNTVLDTFNIGDSLKILAVKDEAKA